MSDGSNRSTSRGESSTRVDSSGSNAARTLPHLRPNQACHQCKRRKTKCDAKRPCGACMKSHAFRIAPLCARGESYEPLPTCTYEGLSNTAGDETSRQESATSARSFRAASTPFRSTRPRDTLPPAEASDVRSNTEDMDEDSTLTQRPAPTSQDAYVPDFASHNVDVALYPSANSASGTSSSDTGPDSTRAADEAPASGLWPTDMILMDYPPSLPPPYIMEHLVDVFFSSVPLGNRVLHRPSFLACLREPPGARKYPSTALLHAICAVASFVSPLVEVPKMPDLSIRKVYEAFVPQSVLEEEHSFVSGGSITFSLEQAMLARAMIEMDIRTRKHPKLATTGLLILCWYYYDNGQWADLWMQASILMRINVALGLNCSGHYSSYANPLALRKDYTGYAEDPAGQERLRNLFWASYMLDRQQHLATGWAPAITDEDISQELPARMADYEAGVNVTGPRQHLSDADLFTNHPPHLTDSWVLYVKTIVLLGRIGTFNRRLELHRRADNNSGAKPPDQMFYPTNLLCDGGMARLIHGKFRDAESSAKILASSQFRTLDNTIIAFRISVPAQFQNPFVSHTRWEQHESRERDNDVDVNAYMVQLGINAAIILLHGPHVDMSAKVCVSRDCAVRAARSILDSVRAMCSTLFDILLLPRAVLSMWECAIGVLALFYYHALADGKDDDAAMYRSEIEVFASVIGRMGEKIPLAFKTRKGLITELDNIVAYAQEFRGREQ